MAQHIYSFEPPRWRPRSQLPVQTGALLAGSLLWLALYGWLAFRLWTAGFDRGVTLNLLLAVVCVLLGVALILAWRDTGIRWRSWLNMLTKGSRWSALSLAELYELTPSEFEEYVTRRIFERQGYRAINTPDVKDGGIDVLVYDEHGQQAVVQCKRYKGTVGEATVRDLYGTMIGNGATHAFLVTTGEISAAAERWAAGKAITLIDGKRLVELAKTPPKV
jgi:restriction system protein